MAPGRLVLVATTHRVAAGLLTWPAWEALRGARHVVTTDAAHPQRAAVEAAGVVIAVIPSEDPRELVRRLVALAADGDVAVLPADDAALGAALAAVLPGLADAGVAPEVEVIAGSYDLPGSRVLDLVAVMDRLRSPGGCPWDAEQTHTSLLPYLLEEAYETVEVIESGEAADLREELGDLLLQVVFHARIAEEYPEDPWSIDDVAGGIVDKLVRRHPHVFGDITAVTAAEVEANWETRKRVEKGRTSAVDGVPLAQPALALAAKLIARAEKHGVGLGLAAAEVPGDPEPYGDLLLHQVAAARRLGIDPEAALRAAARRFAQRVRAAEAGR